jgi:threonine dehydrogenase-like Zn-dependent dehydrogenase
MQAIQFNATIPRYLLGKTLGKVIPSILWSGLSCTYLTEISQPNLPNKEWLKIKTRYGGICGSVLQTIHLHTSPYYSPFISSPFTMGHESIGTIAEIGQKGGGWKVGERIAVNPLLWCIPRGFKKLCQRCSKGEINLCERTTEGALSPGFLTGSCKDTGGSWSSYFAAHFTQTHRVPDSISDGNAIMIEPLSVGLHAVVNNFPSDDETVLIIGAGTIGLCIIAVLRALDSKANILVLARYTFQADAARKLGASDVILAKDIDIYDEIAKLTGGKIKTPIIGKRVFSGGVDRTFECVGSSDAIDDAIRFTRSRGRVVLVGMPGITKSIDWTAVFAQELTVQAATYYSNADKFKGKTWKSFELTIYLLKEGIINLDWMVTHVYSLEDYAKVFKILRKREQSKAIKAVFFFRD